MGEMRDTSPISRPNRVNGIVHVPAERGGGYRGRYPFPVHPSMPDWTGGFRAGSHGPSPRSISAMNLSQIAGRREARS
jgi:hypothetical protein